MKLGLVINGNEDSIEILSHAPECRFRTNSEAERAAHVEIPEPGVYSVLLDGRSYEARVEDRPDGGVVVVIDGFRFEIDVRDPRRWSRNSSGRGGAGIQQITAPMPGKVVRVLISAGDPVEPGQGLIVVEAMKMQNELKATRAGRAVSVPAREGATVVAGEVLATIE
ncbi:MAG TPA: biotin/lipoyl-containing protein [Bryobacteraceae bacterium]|nr:biotin/lipoyl-containing protein [Bryobacteraceae bacterium]